MQYKIKQEHSIWKLGPFWHAISIRPLDGFYGTPDVTLSGIQVRRPDASPSHLVFASPSYYSLDKATFFRS
jgi:hypothetical protein